MSRGATRSGADPFRVHFVLQLKCERDSDFAKISFPARTISRAEIEIDAASTSLRILHSLRIYYIYFHKYVNIDININTFVRNSEIFFIYFLIFTI